MRTPQKTSCKHPDAPHYARGMCRACYRSALRAASKAHLQPLLAHLLTMTGPKVEEYPNGVVITRAPPETGLAAPGLTGPLLGGVYTLD